MQQMGKYFWATKTKKHSTKWVHESNASRLVSAVEICIYSIEQEVYQRFGSKSGSEEVDNICSLKYIYLYIFIHVKRLVRCRPQEDRTDLEGGGGS